MQTFRSRSVTIRFAWSAVDREAVPGAGLAEFRFARQLQLVSAEAPARRPVPVMVVDAGERRAWLMSRGTRALAAALMPPMRPASVGAALVLAAASLSYPPLAALAATYAAVRFVRRELVRRAIHCEIEAHLRLWLEHGSVPAAA